LSKVVNTYWTNGQTGAVFGAETKTRGAGKARPARGAEKLMPRWFVIAISIVLSSLVVVTLNYNAWTNAQREFLLNRQLGSEIEQLTTENSSLQEEIHRLQTDPKTIEREARKLSMGRVNEKVFVPTQ
jgi:cell division protein FtsB